MTVGHVILAETGIRTSAKPINSDFPNYILTRF
jgi:hypothetical protein